jgi:ribosomal-protein-alanine acetyltransferase
MSAVRLRRMREADLEPVMALAASLKDAPHWRRDAYLLALDEGAIPRRIALVAEDAEAGTVMGFAVACLLSPQAELESIAVAEAEQRRGIGRKLFFAMVEELEAAGVCEVLLEVRASNQRARGFYRSLGWNEAGIRPRYYADPEEDAVLMSLKLE